jgi:5'-phosphate synthase pdxT subunit
MVLLADRCVGGSAVITNGQSLIGGMDVLVCRNYFGSQVSSFEMATPCPPGSQDTSDYPGVFIRAPAILNAGADLNVLGRVVATPSRAAAVVLDELEKKIAAGENVIMMGVVDALQRTGTNGQHIDYKKIIKPDESDSTNTDQEEKKESMTLEEQKRGIHLPGAADGTNAREVICAVRKANVLCTAFHPELTEDYRWHEYFFNMVRNSSKVMEEESSN